MRAALYLRVSTDDQTTENQRRELEAAAARTGWQVVATFEDAGISGANGRDQRPGFDRLLRAVLRRRDRCRHDLLDLTQHQGIMAWSVDRLGRSLQDLIGFLAELRAVGCDLYLHQQGVDTTTPAGRALFQMLGVFLPSSNARSLSRVRAGIARARAQGKHLGRPHVAPDVEAAIRAALADGRGIRATARGLGVGVSTVQRIKAAGERTSGRASPKIGPVMGLARRIDAASFIAPLFWCERRSSAQLAAAARHRGGPLSPQMRAPPGLGWPTALLLVAQKLS